MTFKIHSDNLRLLAQVASFARPPSGKRPRSKYEDLRDCVLIQVASDEVRATACTEEVSATVRHSIDGGDTYTTVVPAPEFYNLANRLEGMVTVSPRPRRLLGLKFKAQFQATLRGPKNKGPDEFPLLPAHALNGEHFWFSCASNDIAAALRFANMAAGGIHDEKYGCVLVRSRDDNQVTVGCNGVQLHTMDIPSEYVSDAPKDLDVVLPILSSRTLVKHLGVDPEVNAYVGEGSMTLEIGGLVITARTLAQEYVAYEGIIPAESSISFKVDIARRDFLRAAHSCGVFARDGEEYTRLSFGDREQLSTVRLDETGTVTLFSRSDETGDTSHAVGYRPIIGTGHHDVHLGYRTLIAAVGGLRDERIHYAFDGHAVSLSVPDQSALAVIMPMKVTRGT